MGKLSAVLNKLSCQDAYHAGAAAGCFQGNFHVSEEVLTLNRFIIPKSYVVSETWQGWFDRYL